MEPKRLYRSVKNRVLCGVCGGIGEYFNIDPVIIRILWVALFFLRFNRYLLHTIFGFSVFGASVIFYVAAAVIIPKNPNQ